MSNQNENAALAVDETATVDTASASKQKPDDVVNQYHVIRIEETNEPMGDVDALVGVNGVITRIQRNIAVPVKASLIEVMNNARKSVYKTVKNKQTGEKELVENIVKTYPFSVLAGPYKTRDAAQKKADELNAAS